MDDKKEYKSIKELSSEFVLGEKETENLKKIVEKIKVNKEEFMGLITSLECFFVNSNDVLRKNSNRLLSLVIEKIPDVKLSSKELIELLDFNIKKLKDVVCVNFSVRSIYSLIQHYNINRNDYQINEINDKIILEKIIMCFNMEYLHIPSYNQETRFYSYKTLLSLINNNNLKQDLIDKLEEMLKVILDSIDSEKDPRNIMIIFVLITQIFKLYDKHPKFHLFVRNFFEILELYYPIEFSPPKNSPEDITAENLIDSLNNALSSSETLAEHLIDMLREKISSTAIDTKIEVFKTYRAINKSYSQECINSYFVNIVDNILNEIFNNSDEVLHIEGLITFKEIVDKFSKSIQYKISYTDNESHILKNIEKIFNKCEDLLFSEENLKSCYDAKDVLVVICDYIPQYKESSLKISLKLISNYLNNGKIFYIKNASTILYFSLNKNENITNLTNFLDLNIKQIKNLINSLLNRQHAIIDGLISAVEIVTIFSTKTNNFFCHDDVKYKFEKIYSIWKENRISSEQEQQINRCLNEIITKFPQLNNLTEAIEKVNSTINFIMNAEEPIESNNINELYKYLYLLQEYFTNINNSKQVTEIFFKVFENIFNYKKKSKNCCFQESLLRKLTENILYILEKNIKIEGFEDFYFNYVISLFKNSVSHKIKNTIYKNFDKIFEKLVEKSLITPKNSLNIIINVMENINEKLKINNSLIEESVSIKENISKKCCDKVKKKDILVFQLKTISNLLINENIEDYIASLDISKNNEKNTFEFYESLLQYLDIFTSKSIYGKGFSKYVNELYGIIFYQNINLIKRTKNSHYNVIVESILANLNLYINTYFSVKETKYQNNDVKTQLDFIASLINYLILIKEEKFYKYLSVIFEFLLNYSDSKVDNQKTKIIQFLPETNLFHFNKQILNRLSKENNKKIINLFVDVLEFLKKYIARLESIKLNSQIAYTTTVILLSKYFKFVDSSLIFANSPMLLDIILKSLDSRVNLGLSLNLLKKIIIYTQFKESKNIIKTLCENLVNILQETNEMNINIDILWCLYKIKLSNIKFDATFTKKVIKCLKPFLNDKKRLVRRICGICNNIWTLSE